MEGRPHGWQTGGEASFQLVLIWPHSWPVINPRASVGKAWTPLVCSASAGPSPRGAQDRHLCPKQASYRSSAGPALCRPKGCSNAPQNYIFLFEGGLCKQSIT